MEVQLKPNNPKPVQHSLRDMYAAYTRDLIKTHPEYKFIKGKKIKGRYVEIAAVYKVSPSGQRENVMTYDLFKKIMHAYFKAAQKKIIAGECLNMLNGIGYIQAVRVERDHNKKAVDWKSTYEINERNELTGKLKPVYFTDDDWCRIGWQKNGRLANESAYEFIPSATGSTDKGFRNQFVRALQANPLLKFQFRYCPRVIRKPSTLKQAA